MAARILLAMTQRMLTSAHARISSLPWYWFIVAGFVISVGAVMPLLPLMLLPQFAAEPVGTILLESKSMGRTLLVAVILVPPLETLAFQWVPIKCLRRVGCLRGRNQVLVICSALLFGLVHCYSLLAVVRAFAVGLVFAYAFVVIEDRQQSAYWVVSAIHALRNLFGSVLLHFVR